MVKENLNEKLAQDYLSGKSKEEIARELVDKKILSSDHVWEVLHNFEQHLIGASLLLGKNGKVFQQILSHYKSSVQGRLLLRTLYRQQIVYAAKWFLIFLSFLILDYCLFVFFRSDMLSSGQKWVGILVALTFFGLITSALWALLGFIRMRR